MSCILLKINFKKKNEITKKTLDKITLDLLKVILKDKNMFLKKEKIFIDYQIQEN